MNIRISKPQCYASQGQKPNQEDTLYPSLGNATINSRVFMVCDGMGGHEKGEVASACVAETIGRITEKIPLCSTDKMKQFFENALDQAYQNLDALDSTDSLKKMGTTLTFLSVCTDGILVAHIGDSRVYQFRPNQGVIFKTRDHSLVNDLIASGDISEAEARNHPQRNIITRAIQPHQEYPAKPTYNIINDICKGDLFFMCCDGVLEQLNDNNLCDLLLNDKTLDERIKSIEKECRIKNTCDNNTAYLIEVADVKDDKENEVKSMTYKGESIKTPILKLLFLIILSIFVIISILIYVIYYI